MSEENEMNDFQREMAKILHDVSAKKPTTTSWVRIQNNYFDLKEVCSIQLHLHDENSNSTRLSLYLRNGTEIKVDFVAAARVWEAFTGEKLKYSD